MQLCNCTKVLSQAFPSAIILGIERRLVEDGNSHQSKIILTAYSRYIQSCLHGCIDCSKMMFLHETSR